MKSISVIVPIYYGEKYIAGLIRQVEACREYLGNEASIEASIEISIEILFVNDAPDAPLSENMETGKVHVIVMNTTDNAGIHGARVKGLEKCHGEYVLFLDQDDLIRPEYFYSQLLAIGKGDAVVCQAYHDGKKVYSDNRIFENVVSKDIMLGEWNYIISPGQVLLRKQAISDIWMKNKLKNNGADDWFLWLCMIAEGCSFSLNHDILYEHVLNGKNYSDNIVNMLRSEQEVIHIVQEKKVFSDNDRMLLMDGFFKRNVMRAQELHSLKKKWKVLDMWMKLKQNHVKPARLLSQTGVKSIAIYGCAVLGEYLYDELKDDIDVKYFIDRNAKEMQKEIPVYSLQDALPEVDGMIVTLIDEAEKVEKEIKDVFHGTIVILKDWIFELEEVYE